MQKYIFFYTKRDREIFIADITKKHYLCTIKFEFIQLYYQPFKSQHHE